MPKMQWKDLSGTEKIRILISLVCFAYLGYMFFKAFGNR